MKKNYKYLNNINFPSDIKKLSADKLQKLSNEVREELISAVSETGGHLGAGLGVVELTVALNYILPQRAGQFEMLTKTIIMPAIKRQDIEVFNSLKFLVPEEPNEDGNLTYMFIADPYLEDKNYDIFEILVSQYGRARAEEYFDRWITCFAYEQEVISFR